MTVDLAPAAGLPKTFAVRRVLQSLQNRECCADRLFLENWEVAPRPEVGIALRVHQIRRANPALAAEIRAELKRGRPLTELEREALVA
jgi:hypothetical protein